MSVRVSARVGRVPNVCRPFDLGGGVIDDPAEPSEDCIVWLPEHRALVVAAGSGHASGIAGCYFSGSSVARVVAGIVAARLAGRPTPGETVVVEPLAALADVAAAWRHTMRGATAVGSPVESLEGSLWPILAATASQRDESDRYDFYVGRGCHMAMLRLLDTSMELSQIGAIRVFLFRAGGLEQVAPLATLGAEARAAGETVPEGLENVVTRVVTLTADGPHVSLPLSASVGLRGGDRLVVTPRIAGLVSEEELADWLSCEKAAEPGWIADRFMARAAEATSPSGHPTVVAISVD